MHGRKRAALDSKGCPTRLYTMKLALFMSCATALRLAPTMVQQPRRAVLAGGAAAAGSLILPAHAKKPLCLPGTNSAKALGGPGYTIGILEHDTPSFARGTRSLRASAPTCCPATHRSAK